MAAKTDPMHPLQTHLAQWHHSPVLLAAPQGQLQLQFLAGKYVPPGRLLRRIRLFEDAHLNALLEVDVKL